MNLASVFGGAWPDVDVSELSEHSNEIVPDCAFFAVAAKKQDAERHAKAALDAGAKLVVSPHVLELSRCFVYADLAAERGMLAAKFYGHPAKQLSCIGVTGTNGKTSVAYYIASLSDLLGMPCGYIGTLGWGRIDELVDPNMTTPSPVALQKRLAGLVTTGCRRVVIEVSSHALDQDRAAEVPFEAAIFTNLTRDHLDYHGTMDAYAAAKLKLFTEFPLQTAVLSLSDSFSEQIAQACTAPIVRYGQQLDADATQAVDGGVWRWRRTASSDQVSWSVGGEELKATVPVVADFAIDNLTAALAVLHPTYSLEALRNVVQDVRSVPGRMEIVARHSPHGTVVVDYAHTPDALTKALQSLRQDCVGRLICVVGCGGDRDRGKRPQMAAAAVKLADRSWFTSDNPRTESPEQIIADMQQGVTDESAEVEANVDRREAIRAALMNATLEDVVLIAGKGHEHYQEVGTKKYPFDDAAVARDLLGEM